MHLEQVLGDRFPRGVGSPDRHAGSGLLVPRILYLLRAAEDLQEAVDAVLGVKVEPLLVLGPAVAGHRDAQRTVRTQVAGPGPFGFVLGEGPVVPELEFQDASLPRDRALKASLGAALKLGIEPIIALSDQRS